MEIQEVNPQQHISPICDVQKVTRDFPLFSDRIVGANAPDIFERITSIALRIKTFFISAWKKLCRLFLSREVKEENQRIKQQCLYLKDLLIKERGNPGFTHKWKSGFDQIDNRLRELIIKKDLEAKAKHKANRSGIDLDVEQYVNTLYEDMNQIDESILFVRDLRPITCGENTIDPRSDSYLPLYLQTIINALE